MALIAELKEIYFYNFPQIYNKSYKNCL